MTLSDKEIKKLMRKKNVNMVVRSYKRVRGERTEHMAIVVGVTKKYPRSRLAAKDVVPAYIDGQLTDVVEIGEIRPLKDAPRKVVGGDRIETPFAIGTGGLVVRRDGENMLLTNRHVVDDFTDHEAAKDVPVYNADKEKLGYSYDAVDAHFKDRQAGDVEGNIFQRFWRFLKNMFGAILKFLGVIDDDEPEDNRVDAALVRLSNAGDAVRKTVKEIGTLTRWGSAEMDAVVRKYGMTSRLTTGRVLNDRNGLIHVRFGSGMVVAFHDQIFIEDENEVFSQPGDSGSIIVNERDEAVGLLFARSTGGFTFANSISHVKNKLDFTM